MISLYAVSSAKYEYLRLPKQIPMAILQKFAGTILEAQLFEEEVYNNRLKSEYFGFKVPSSQIWFISVHASGEQTDQQRSLQAMVCTMRFFVGNILKIAVWPWTYSCVISYNAWRLRHVWGKVTSRGKLKFHCLDVITQH